MAHERESFPTLENIDTEVGEVLSRLNEGDSPIALDLVTKKNGLIGFSFKDVNGNVVLPTLNADGSIPVELDAGTTLRARGSDVDGDDTVKMVLATIPLTANKTYTKLSAQGSCFRDTEFEIVLIDDVGVTDTETILDEFLTGPGQFTTKSGLTIDEFNTNGFTGTINLVVRAINLNKASKTMASISVNEIVV